MRSLNSCPGSSASSPSCWPSACWRRGIGIYNAGVSAGMGTDAGLPPYVGQPWDMGWVGGIFGFIFGLFFLFLFFGLIFGLFRAAFGWGHHGRRPRLGRLPRPPLRGYGGPSRPRTRLLRGVAPRAAWRGAGRAEERRPARLPASRPPTRRRPLRTDAGGRPRPPARLPCRTWRGSSSSMTSPESSSSSATTWSGRASPFPPPGPGPRRSCAPARIGPTSSSSTWACRSSTGWRSRGAFAGLRRPDHHAHRPRRRDRQGGRPGAGRGRLRDQAVQPARAHRAGARRAPPPRRRPGADVVRAGDLVLDVPRLRAEVEGGRCH